jgi:hypothetical protein
LKLVEIDTWNAGPRTTVSVGDEVRCMPRVGGSFDAPVTKILASEETGEVVEIEVVGGRGHTKAIRTFAPDRVKPKPKRRPNAPVGS